MVWTKHGDEVKAKAKAMRDSGLSITAIARHLGVGCHDTIKRWLDPAFAAKSRAYQRGKYNGDYVARDFLSKDRSGPTREEIIARCHEIPPDTRDLTARICGDPLPGRDALSRRFQ